MNKLNFHIARADGLEFVFSSGHALAYPTHTHISVHTITLVRSGTVLLRRPGASFVYRPGDVYAVAQHEPHSPRYSDTFDIVSLCVDAARYRLHADTSILRERFIHHAHQYVEKGLLSFSDVGRIEESILCLNRMEESIACLQANADLPPGKAELDALLQRYSTDLSRYSAIRAFRKKSGLTPHQYIVQNRIREAKKLLTTGESVVDAALHSGFYDQSHLYRWFNRCLGITPHHYKQACLFLDEH